MLLKDWRYVADEGGLIDCKYRHIAGLMFNSINFNSASSERKACLEGLYG